ncbi:multiple epidermal growth factor-like domains protein 6 [Crassostrea angulata]|uniref:multiple epidermal growth factor-like domains protein 6 n=1 Tax=Magallana angulata TaxID=2784310 RepID=UPI0022B0A8F9|nr:multiple epidermal growth factor-like domains protein 6 [Crassostrea angulata]
MLCFVNLFLFIRYTEENLECSKLSSNSCCVNQYLNEVNNSCIECPYGRFGWNCKSSCPSGYYGRLCKSSCECDALECHHATGCTTTIGTTNVQPGEGLEIEPAVNLFMNILTTNAKQKHTQGKLNVIKGRLLVYICCEDRYILLKFDRRQ